MEFLYEKYHHIEVAWRENLHGGGLKSGRQFISVVRELLGKVDRIHEICAGPGFIGFSLLAEGLCNSLSLSDINPEAIEAQQETIRRNDLAGTVSSYLSIGLDDVPESEKWDLVVSNPPHFGEPAGEGIISDDPDWEFHKNFFRNVHKHLHHHGTVLIQENYIGSDESVFMPYIEEGHLEVLGSYMNVINIEKTVNPYFYLWLRKKSSELIEEVVPVETIVVNLDDRESQGPARLLEQHKKYRFEFHNNTDAEVQISFFNDEDLNLFRLKPLAVLPPGQTGTSGIFYLTKGLFRISDIKRKDKVFGLLEVSG